MIEKELAANITECPVIEELWKLDDQESKILISHSDVGPYIHVFCPPDYHVIGPGLITCLKGGVWDDLTLPQCSASSLFAVPTSTMVLITILAGCGALIIITFTFILAHLLYFKTCPIFPSRSKPRPRDNEYLESDTSMTYHQVNKRYHSVSTPQYPTRNGQPMTPSQYGHMTYHDSNDIATVTNGNVFVNEVFQPDEQNTDYQDDNNKIPPPPPPPPPIRVDSTGSLSHSVHIPQQLQQHENRTSF